MPSRPSFTHRLKRLNQGMKDAGLSRSRRGHSRKFHFGISTLRPYSHSERSTPQELAPEGHWLQPLAAGVPDPPPPAGCPQERGCHVGSAWVAEAHGAP